ncbi:MAG: ComF family protein [Chloracidobacterium sp.]|nr:ComF family protein [Chloracidobacterium sp.]
MGPVDSILSLAYPQQCAVCGGAVENRSDGCACSDCWASTTVFTGDEMLCEKCGAYFGPQAAPVAVRCHKCDEHHYDRALAAGIYEKALSASILRLKSSPSIPRRLRRMIHSAGMRLDPADLIVPVPLSRMRQIERGFNQADVIALELSKTLCVPVDRHSLIRRVHTPMHRAAMDRKARELTVENAFYVTRPNVIEGRTILLVDDVFTSGATASSCAKVLKKRGAATVDIFTIARAVMD